MRDDAIDIEAFTSFAVHLAEVASAEILPRFRSLISIGNKAAAGRFDPVTIADREAEAAIRREIHRVYPDHGILGEEHGFERGSSPLTWVIDPIDGTRAFILGQLHWGTLVALHDGARPVIGVMHQPFTRETFVGSPTGSEWRRESEKKRLAVRPAAQLADVFLCATDPGMFASAKHRRGFDRLADQVRAVRYGGDCYTPCMVAAGCADLVVEAGIGPWDVQPLMPIIEGAGGVITDWSGGPAQDASTMVIASSAAIHTRAIELLNG